MKAFSELTSASQVNNSDLLAISQASGNSYASKKTTVKDVADFANQNLAEEYDSTSTYAVDDFVMYESALYKCVTAVSSAEAFDPTKWTQVVVTDEMGSGGGTTVIANPTGTPTDDLNTLQVGNTIYQVMGEGGGGGFGLVQSGHTVYTLTGQNLEDRVSITFDTPFPEVPNVALSLSDPSRGQYYNPQTGLGVMNVTKNGFDILIKSSSQAVAGDIAIYWIATTKFSGNGIFHPVIYSLEEREIGVWTDGKPLYSKVIEIPSFSSSSPISIDVSSLNVDTMVDVTGEAYAISNNIITETLYFPIYKFANTYTAQVRFTTNTIQIFHERLNEYTSGIVKILYTKSTDTAGSGNWTPQGVPTHHYSTDEQVIGTWIDGSTLYEKTYAVTFSSNYVDVQIPTTHKVKGLDGGVDSNNYDNFIHLGYGTSQNDMCGAYEYEAGKIRFQNFYYSSRPNGWLTVRYTKSS